MAGCETQFRLACAATQARPDRIGNVMTRRNMLSGRRRDRPRLSILPAERNQHQLARDTGNRIHRIERQSRRRGSAAPIADSRARRERGLRGDAAVRLGD